MSCNSFFLISLVLVVTIFTGCARLPDNSRRSVSFAYPYPEKTTMGRAAVEKLHSHSEESAYLMLSDGLDAFVARGVLAQSAEQTIDAQYYLLHNDTVGKLFINELLKAADRGVRVRLLLDDIDMAGRDHRAALIDKHPNLEVRFFNPFSRDTNRFIQYITGLGKQTRRAHNKSFTVDNVATIVGGRNIGNEYFVADPEFDFLDIDVLVVGPIAQDVSRAFDEYWNHELSYPITTLSDDFVTEEQVARGREELDSFAVSQRDSWYLKNLRDSSLAKAIASHDLQYTTAKGKIVVDSPDKLKNNVTDKTFHLSRELEPYFDSIQRELIIVSPYFVPGRSGVKYLRELRQKGVRVRILTNSFASTDVPIVHAGYANYRYDLLRMGVDLYELNANLGQKKLQVFRGGKQYESRSSLHAKSLVFDGETVFIGSLNLDPRSFIQNTEIGVVFDSPEIASELVNFFDEDLDKVAFRLKLHTDRDGIEFIRWHGIIDNEKVAIFPEPNMGIWSRFLIGLMGLLPIESQI